MYFVLTRTVKTLQKINSAVFISPFNMHTLYEHSLLNKEGLKGKETAGHSFSFLLCRCFQCMCLANIGK